MKQREVHGMSDTAIYAVWKMLVQRCTNPKNKDWADYGGRGITVCDEWRQSFAAFFAAVGHAPEGMWLDRIHNDRGYGPGNVRWATPVEQANNRRSRSLNADNTSGIAGVSWHACCRTWRVQIQKRDIGSRRDFFEACCLRKSAENKLGLTSTHSRKESLWA